MSIRLDTLTDDDLDALCRGRITRWHAERVTAEQLRAYLEAAEWASSHGPPPGEEWYVTKPTPGTDLTDKGLRCFERSSDRWSQAGFLLTNDGAPDEMRHNYDAIESIAAIEDRGELAVWMDVREVST